LFFRQCSISVSNSLTAATENEMDIPL